MTNSFSIETVEKFEAAANVMEEALAKLKPSVSGLKEEVALEGIGVVNKEMDLLDEATVESLIPTLETCIESIRTAAAASKSILEATQSV